MLQIFTKRRGEKGFTLIELLVVIAIIGILATIVLVSLNTARQKARDSRRIGDLRQLQLALEIFADNNNGNYPTTAQGTAILTPDEMPSVPSDPLNGNDYPYCANGTTDYTLGANLEDDEHGALDNDVDAATANCAFSVGSDPLTCGASGVPPSGDLNGEYCVQS